MIRSHNSKNRQYNEQKIPKEMIWSRKSKKDRQYYEQRYQKRWSEAVIQRTDNTINKRYQKRWSEAVIQRRKDSPMNKR
jgi:hypothetical protein